MDILSSPIPHISISLAPPEEIPAEPFSPFAKSSFTLPQQSDDSFRPVHLTPPPTHTSFRRQHSPLRVSASSPVEHSKQTGKGLDPARFEALLNASRDKPLPPKKDAVDLRREVAMKAHQNKQAGRRALFLSKVLAPPSPTAAVTPKTPPESPAIFHYSLPSPGLVSPIAHYESLHDQDGISPELCQPWVEQVDFKVATKPEKLRPRLSLSRKPRQPLPSLEQISARINRERGRNQAPRHEERVMQTAPPVLVEPQPRLVIGRLRMPVRKSAATPTIKISLYPDEDDSEEYSALSAPVLPPKSPLLTTPLKLQVTTLAVSRSRNVSPTQLTQANLMALNSREVRSSAMLNTLRRRTQSTTFNAVPRPGFNPDETDPRKGFRRHSAPPDSIDLSKRLGFEHPVLRLPGAF